MATDTTALTEAIRVMRYAQTRSWAERGCVTTALLADAGLGLLAALSGVPERIAALEGVARAAREIPVTRYLSNPHEITWRLDAVEAALAALDGAGEGVGGG